MQDNGRAHNEHTKRSQYERVDIFLKLLYTTIGLIADDPLCVIFWLATQRQDLMLSALKR
ncbi:MAG: hypothetical protein CME32_11520 [Gimesia sp.]|nr:hypothetical protein [Gimesia sp.]